jgi:hypothetical protein
VVVGAWKVDELPEGSFEVLELPDELLEPFDEVPDDALLSDDVPVDFAAASVDPGRTASTTPATATLARDTVTVVVLRRRLPRLRSATARASSLLFMPTSLAYPAVRPVRGGSQQALNALSVPCPLVLAWTRETGIIGQ